MLHLSFVSVVSPNGCSVQRRHFHYFRSFLVQALRAALASYSRRVKALETIIDDRSEAGSEAAGQAVGECKRVTVSQTSSEEAPPLARDQACAVSISGLFGRP